MKYYVNEGNKIGKVFEAPNDVYAVSYATGYSAIKKWKRINVYCQTTREYVTREFPVILFDDVKDWLRACKHLPEFIATDKPLWND